MKKLKIIWFIALAAACGGGQTTGAEPVGNDHSKGGDGFDAPDQEGPVSGPDGEGKGGEAGTDGDGDASAIDLPAVTFKLVNTAGDDLVFSLDKGWQPVIFAYSGKPPKAKPILMFPTFCTASCDVGDAERCPSCPQPEKVKDIRAAEKRQVVNAGASFEVPWDGEVFVYEKTRGTQDGRKAKCECYRKEPVAPETYTVRACGLRLTQSAKKSTKLQCVEGSMTFPSDEPQVVEFEFGAP